MSAIQQLITEHMDIWTAADTGKRSGRGRASGNAGSVYGVKKLRELILELAVRGKLVPQDANDEPASELLKRIKAEKAKFVAEGKIKKEKPLAAIGDDEKPFELPHGWEWARFGDVCSYIQRGKGPDYVEQSDFIVISQKCVRWSGFDLTQARCIDPTSISKYEPIRLLVEGDILWNSTGTGTIGRACLVTSQAARNTLVADSHVTVVRPIADLSTFIWRWIQCPTVQSEIEGVASGTTNQIELNTSTVIAHLLPLPPLTEQHRIVAKVDELMALCDQLEVQHSNAAEAHEKLVSHLLGTLTQSQNADDFNANWQRIAAHFDTLFTTEASIDALKQTLLQLAVMGKLVPQDANDEPASELLKHIQAEKAKLVAEGKIKKDKPLTAITEDEQPFELPQEWTWVKLEDLMPEFQNGASSRGDANGDSVIVLRLADINDRCISLEDPRELLISPNMIDKYRLSIGDILIVRVNGSADLVGGFVLCDQLFDGIYCDHFIRMRLSQSILNSRFLTLVGASHLVRDRIKDLFITTAGQKTVNQGHIGSLVIPLLSIKEQHRIVAKVDALMAICDQLKTRITAANQQQQKLADVLVEHATAQ